MIANPAASFDYAGDLLCPVDHPFLRPGFLFPVGLSAFLSGRKKTDREASLFLLKRGIWLILVEMVVVSLRITLLIFFIPVLFCR